jgi:hypothetical protein
MIQVLDPGPRILGAGSGSAMLFQGSGSKGQVLVAASGIWVQDLGADLELDCMKRVFVPDLRRAPCARRRRCLQASPFVPLLAVGLPLSEKFVVG